MGRCWSEEQFRLFSGLWVDVGQRSSSGCLVGCRYVLVRGAILVVEWLVGMCWSEEKFRLHTVDCRYRLARGVFQVV